jgi:membrane protein implicated in regulation of membrane protease activity
LNTRSFLLYAIVVSLIEQAVLLAVLLVLLPAVGLALPVWAVVGIVLALATVSVVLTRLNLRAIGLKPARSPDVGVRGKVVRALEPRGYVRVGNELWPATTEGESLPPGREVTVRRMDGLLLIVDAVAESDASD